MTSRSSPGTGSGSEVVHGPPPPPPDRDPGDLSEYIDGMIFDTDGVVTRTADVHRRAWKTMFDAYLRDRERGLGEPFAPFTDEDYRLFVDGKSRSSGVVGFLDSRSIDLDRGNP